MLKYMVTITEKDVKYYALSSLLLLLLCIFYFFDERSESIPYIAFILNFIFIVRFRKSLPIFLIFIFFSLYSYIAIKANVLGVRVSAWTFYNTPDYINKVLLLNSIFIYSLGNLLNPRTVCNKMNLDAQSFKSHYIFWPLLVVGLLMIQFGIKGDTILDSGSYGGGSVQRSTMHEYFILIYFVLLMVAPKNKFVGLTVVIILILYVAKTILYGGRIEAMQIGILYIYYRWILDRKENRLVVYSIALVGYYVSSVFTKIRENALPLLTGDYMYYLSPIKNEELIKRDYIMNNQGDVLQSSARFLGLVHDGILDTATRVASFFYMLLSVFLPSALVPEYANLGNYRRDYAGAGGGGLISAYFYVWMGYLGPFAIGAFLAYFINKGHKTNQLGFKVYAVILLVMFPRWYAYTPLIVFKFCFLTVVVYLIIKLLYKSFFIKKTTILKEF